MHAIKYSCRLILPAELPTVRDMDGTARPATPDELLNMGIVPLGRDLYSCAEQYRSDADDVIDGPNGLERVWWAAHDDGPWASEAEKLSYPRSPDECAQRFGRGTLLTQGRKRYQELPAEQKPKALRARVVTGKPVVTASLAGQQVAMNDAVGLVDGAPLVDLTTPAAVTMEAQRLAAIPDVPEVQVALVAMADVDEAEQVTLDTGLIPHGWAGER